MDGPKLFQTPSTDASIEWAGCFSHLRLEMSLYQAVGRRHSGILTSGASTKPSLLCENCLQRVLSLGPDFASAVREAKCTLV